MPQRQPPALRVSAVTKRFGALVANDAISFEVRPGEVVALLGENGAGKTTLMNILFGHYVADEGRVEAFGHELPPGDPRAALDAGIGMVHQHFTLAENLTVLDNVMLGTESLWRWRSTVPPRGPRSPSSVRRAAWSSIRTSSSAGSASASASASRSSRRSTATRGMLILDEPTAVLTPQEAETLFATLRKLVAEGLAIIFISHKLGEVLAIADRVVVLRARAGSRRARRRRASRAELAAADGRPPTWRRRASSTASPARSRCGWPVSAPAPRRPTASRRRRARAAPRRDRRYRRRLRQRPGGARRCSSRHRAPDAGTIQIEGEALRMVARGRARRRHRPHPGRPARESARSAT
jgi:ABC-type branched-subunit amino acid transport system ATPase component